jgi:tyrosine-protein kinase Etk/Wzc
MLDSADNSSPESTEDLNLMDYLIVLAKHSRMIVYTTVVVTILTYVVLVCLPNKYTATARLLPPKQNMTLSAQLLNILGGDVTPGSGEGMHAGLAANLLGIKSNVELYISIMKCNTVLDDIITEYKLKKLYKVKYIEDARKALMKNTNIRGGQKDNIITIEVTDRERERAAKIANSFISELDKLLRDLTRQEAKERLAFLEKERSQTNDNLTKAEEDLRKFSEKNSVLQIDVQTKEAIEYIAKYRGEIDAKEIQIQVLRQQATPFNYDVIRLETELKGLKEKLRDAESKWENCVGDVCFPTSKAPTLNLEYFRLLRGAKFQENLYQLYIRLVQIAKMDMARNVTVVQVIDHAIPPEKRSNKRLFPTLVAGALTFILMSFVAFGKEYWQKVQTVERETQRLALLIGYLKPWSQLLQRMRSFLRIKFRK